MNEKVLRRLLRVAAWISIAGALLGVLFQWSALYRALGSHDAAERAAMRDAALTAAVFWAILWVGLPLGVLSFRRFLAWPEKLLAMLIALSMAVGTCVALTL